jgi:hypothetical protein
MQPVRGHALEDVGQSSIGDRAWHLIVADEKAHTAAVAKIQPLNVRPKSLLGIEVQNHRNGLGDG